MITEPHKQAIIQAIGKKHIAKIKAYAATQGVKKEDGADFSNSTFSAVLNGRLDHPQVEETIFAAAEHYLELELEKKGRRKEFVQRVKQV